MRLPQGLNQREVSKEDTFQGAVCQNRNVIDQIKFPLFDQIILALPYFPW
jgi:hypothetical protein